jgi:acyl transferase domain-containing protein
MSASVPGSVSGDRIGVFIGANRDDYAALLHRGGPEPITAHSNTGLQRGMIANRVSCTLGLTGPSMTVDTAQEAVIRLAHQSADLQPADVQYVELHGTGTRVGDPVEAAALDRVAERGLIEARDTRRVTGTAHQTRRDTSPQTPQSPI